MKIAVVTDLHANREAVQAVLDHAQAQGAERHAFVGDFVGYGADPAWVVEKVREMVRGGAWAVQGKHDAAVAPAPAPHMRPDARRVVEWTQARLTAAQRDFLARLPLTQAHGELLFVHANAAEPAAWACVHSRAEAAQSLLATTRRITFCGHMHEPRLYHRSAVGKQSGAQLALALRNPAELVLTERATRVRRGPLPGRLRACMGVMLPSGVRPPQAQGVGRRMLRCPIVMAAVDMTRSTTS